MSSEDLLPAGARSLEPEQSPDLGRKSAAAVTWVTWVTFSGLFAPLTSVHGIVINKKSFLETPIMRNQHVLILALICTCGFVVAGTAQSQQAPADSGRKVIRKVEPRYPDVAKRMNLGGTVKVVAVVSADGKVTKVEPVGGSPLLVEAAQAAISQWKFAPGGESREAVELHFTP